MKENIYSFFENMSIYSVNFLTWTSAIIAALLALTTIIFSQFNERLIQKISDLTKEIEVYISDVNHDRQIINQKINEIIYLLSNQAVYKLNLFFFFLISYLSGLLWAASGIGYSIDQPDGSLGDIIIISFSTFGISAAFFVLPIILIKFNKNSILKVDNKSRLKFSDIIKYFNSITRVSIENIIKEYIQPTINIKLSYSGSCGISLKQEIPISKISYILEFVSVNNIKQIIKITNNSAEKYNEYMIKPLNKNENNFEGLFDLIRESTHQYLYVYKMDKKELVASFTMDFSINTDTELVIKINEKFKTTPDIQIIDILSSNKWMHIFSEESPNKYNLVQKK
ncbi:hypothetical protein ACIQXU_17630 [Peribacillus sp. NPDC097284]|uniref:hypothetical protein n=1 Tax=Peribacillus sp. NPDC097284 TaxID=3364401 RepID=UPI003815D09D